MRASKTVSSATTSDPIPVDSNQNPFGVSVSTVVTGTNTHKVQHTFDDIFDSSVTPVWYDHTSLTGKTANADGNYAYPVTAVRLNVTAYTNGSVKLTVLQA